MRLNVSTSCVGIFRTFKCIKRDNQSWASFRETSQWLKFPLNGLWAQSSVSPVVGLLRDARRITAAEMKYMRRTAG